MTVRQQTVLDTLVYFSVNKRLATAEEIFRYQVRGAIPLLEIIDILHTIPGVKEEKGVYGFVKEFDVLWRLRQEKMRESIRRFRKLRRYGSMLISIPCVEGVFMAGSLAFSTGNAKKTSDIDIFVVTAKHRIWLTRILLTLITHITGTRRRGAYDENLFCLNHYVTKDNLQRLDHDQYSAQLYADFVPIGTQSQFLLERFRQENSWIRGVFPQARGRVYRIFVNLKPWPGSKQLTQVLKLRWFDWLESLARLVQRRKILSNPLSDRPHARIKATDQELEFHPKPNSVRMSRLIQKRMTDHL